MEQKEIKSYLKEVKKNCPFPFRKRLLAELRESVLGYVEEHPDCTMDDVVARFGVAEMVGYGYILEMDEKERKKLLDRAHWIRCCIIAGVVICILLIAGGAAWIHYDNSKPLVYYYGE